MRKLENNAELNEKTLGELEHQSLVTIRSIASFQKQPLRANESGSEHVQKNVIESAHCIGTSTTCGEGNSVDSLIRIGE